MSECKKCIVWDLDQTLWDGVALEGDIRIKPDVCRSIEVLDRRGILHSIASRGDADLAAGILREHHLDEYFLCPQINWLPKSNNIVTISKELGISLDSVAFIDDDPFEREQIGFMLPQVMVIDAERAGHLSDMREFNPADVTTEAESRRHFYQAEHERSLARDRYPTREEFLRSCAMVLRIRSLSGADIPRAVELATRTHQLNTTGRMFGPDELRDILLRGHGSTVGQVAELTDKYGPYGIIGLALIDHSNGSWRLEYLAMSCRILGRGIERAFLINLLGQARDRGVSTAEALFRETGRNRMMRTLYQMMGFRASGPSPDGGFRVFRLSVGRLGKAPDWVQIL